MKYLIAIIILISNLIVAHGQEEFDPIDSNKIIDKLSIRLSVIIPSYNELNQAVLQLTEQQEMAKSCLVKVNDELKKLNKQTASSPPQPIDNNQPLANTSTEQAAYIKNKQQKLLNRQEECEVVLVRTSEAIDAFSAKANELAKQELLTSSENIIDNVTKMSILASDLMTQFDYKILIQQLQLTQLSQSEYLIILALLILGFLLGRWLKKVIVIAEQRHTLDKHYNLQNSICSILPNHIIIITQVLLLLSFLAIKNFNSQYNSLLIVVGSLYLIYVGYLMLIKIIFQPPTPNRPVLKIAPEIATLLIHRLKLLGFVLSSASLVHIALMAQQLPADTLALPTTIFITVLTINLISLLILINKIKLFIQASTAIKFWTNLIILLIVFSILITSWLGLIQLALYILQGVFFSILILTSLFVLEKAMTYCFNWLNGIELPWQKTIRKKLGLKHSSIIPELLWLKIVTQISILITILILLLKVWGISSRNYQLVINGIINGFDVANMHITPIRILASLIVFTTISITTRLIKTKLIINNANQGYHKGTTIAFATMLGYAGFTIAIVFALFIAGVDFSGLTIIFGALSVGIGFGLQNIVNNFVSGLIILIERPIKVGDRIKVGNIEGHVININIRSTQIKDFNKHDIIVPNSDLISSSVTNLMFTDNTSRIVMYVQVSYDEDITKVKNMLLEIASRHQEVVVDSANVLLDELADNGIKLKIYCLIHNVNKQIKIKSEIYYDIERTLKEHGIKIPYPQREIHYHK